LKPLKNNLIKNLSILLAAMLLLILSCNPTRDRWMNRKWHSMTGHFNIFFNGEQKLLDATTQIEKSHVHDFNKVLDVFPYGDEASAKTSANLLDEALKKFSGTIQLHTIGSYTDEAYFNIAKCRFFKRDYYSAVEAFQFVIGQYEKKGYKNISSAWIAKCYVGLNKIEEAEAVVGLLVSNKNIDKKDIAEIFATAADINIRLEKYKSAIPNLQRALTGDLKKEQKIRYNYILGQLYMLTDNKQEALFHFDKVIKMNPPYDFAFNANINITKIYDPRDKQAVNKVRRNLKRMLRDDKNIDYLDQIYYELGKLELSQKNFPIATSQFKNSVSNSKSNKVQKTKSYLELAKLFFETKDYKKAKAYYDSTAQNIDPSDKNYNKIKNTKEVLSDLINNLVVFETEDSLQRLARMSPNSLKSKVEEWVFNDKKQKELEAKLAKKRAKIEESFQKNQGGEENAPPPLTVSADGSWYFYNNSLVASGKNDFFSSKKWGQRANEDFWRIAAKEKPKQNDADENGKPKDTSQTAGADKKIDYTKQDANMSGQEVKPEEPVTVNLFGPKEKDKEAWIKNVPFTPEAKQKSNDKILEALHNLGKIYYDKLKENKDALKYWSELEKRFPANEYEPEAYYYLYKIHIDSKEKTKSDKNKSDLISQYPEHPYAMLIQGKPLKTDDNDANKSLLQFYENTYSNYTAENYIEVKKMKIEAEKKFPGNNMRAKFDYINTLAIGKTESLENFKTALVNITKEYKETDVAKASQATLDFLNKKQKMVAAVGGDISVSLFELDDNTPQFYVFAMKNEKADFTIFNEKIATYNEQYASLDNLRSNPMLSNEGYQLLVVREFPNLAKGVDYIKGLKAVEVISKQMNVTEPYIEFIVSKETFKKILKDKRIDEYYKFYQKRKVNTSIKSEANTELKSEIKIEK
jgi:tetratricopeptide (TPR) repeat protein